MCNVGPTGPADPTRISHCDHVYKKDDPFGNPEYSHYTCILCGKWEFVKHNKDGVVDGNVVKKADVMFYKIHK